jgi:hypothetical protein
MTVSRRRVLQQLTLLMGGMLSGPTLRAFEMTDFNTKKWERFTDSEAQAIDMVTLADIAEMIIPRTHTAGAQDAQVPAFIVRMVQDCYSPKDQESFAAGLAALQSQNFVTQTQEEKTKVLKAIEKKAKADYQSYAEEQSELALLPSRERFEKQTVGIPFWRLVKELTLLGYFTSEICIQESFDFMPIPGKLELVKYKKGQKLYAY